MSITATDRFVRQADLVPQDKLQDLTVSVIGLGAIGRPLALQLAAIGARKLHLIDPDVIEIHNVTTQGYSLNEVGQSKVDALSKAIAVYDSSITVGATKDVFRTKHVIGEVAFCCVDSIQTRSVIWRSLASRIHFWGDGRMLGETVRVLAATDQRGRDYYSSTLFSAEEAQIGRCTSRSTLYAAQIAAGLLVHQFTRWLRGQAVDGDLMLNLSASEWIVVDCCKQPSMA
jgi:sulfur carrier protein ThiS adenylyltransferase